MSSSQTQLTLEAGSLTLDRTPRQAQAAGATDAGTDPYLVAISRPDIRMYALEEMMNDEVPISPTLAHIARRFDIDLSAVAEEALRDRILRQPLPALTSRMAIALLAARQEAQRFGHAHIGCEHVFLGILLDPHSIPTQILRDMGAADDVVQQIQTLLGSDVYNRGLGRDGNDKDNSTENA